MQKNVTPGVISHEGIEAAVNAPSEPEDAARLRFLNQKLKGAGTAAPAETDWNSVVAAGIAQTRENQLARLREQQTLEEWCASDKDVTDILTDEQQADEAEEQMWLESRKLHYLSILPGATEENLHDRAVEFLTYMIVSEEVALAAWAMRAWENSDQWYARHTPSYSEADDLYNQDFDQSPERAIPADWLPFVREGETRWMVERNAAAAGFMREKDYLHWRKENEA
ncbi:MAG: mismatch repair protein MutL [Proteobacteria bacterium]|nr:mismatch repair protein MutL [Pseudomonadota bacterium]